MIAVRMVQPTVYEIVDMVAMGYRFVSAVWTVRVRAMDFGRALHGICGVDRDSVLIHVILVHVPHLQFGQRHHRCGRICISGTPRSHAASPADTPCA